MSRIRLNLFALSAFFLVLFMDFGTKYYVSSHLPLIGTESLFFPYGGIAVFKNFFGVEFSIVHAINKGAAWGLFAQYQSFLLAGRIVSICVLTIYALFFNKSRMYDIPLFLIIAGALANVIDYFIYGHVVDMFSFVFWGYHYPVFNVADSAICVGVACLIFLPKQLCRGRENVA